MPVAVQGRFRRWVVRVVRLSAGLVLALTLLAALLLAYLRWVGLPGPLRDQIENRLRASGWDLRFGKLRLQGRVLVGEQVNLRSTGPGILLSLEADRAELTFAQSIWQAGVLRPSHLRVAKGRVAAHTISSNGPPGQISLDQIQMELALGPSDSVQISDLKGRFLGIETVLKVSLTNASALRRWERSEASPAVADWPAHLAAWSQRLETLRVTQPATLQVDLSGDGKDPASLRAQVRAQARQLASTLGIVDNLDLQATAAIVNRAGDSCDWQIDARLGRVASQPFDLVDAHWTGQGAVLLTNSALQTLKTDLRSASVRTPWLTNGPTLLAVESTRDPRGWRTGLTLRATDLASPWAHSVTNLLALTWTHDGLEWNSGSGEWRLESGPVRTPWGELRQARLVGHASPAPALSQWRQADETWGGWSKLAPLEITWEAEVDDWNSPKLCIDRATCAGAWRAPELFIERLHAELYDGRVETAASLDVAARDLRARSVFDFDLTQLAAFLSPEAQAFLAQLQWSEPPEVAVDAQLTLPPWTGDSPAWREEILSSLRLAGEFSATNASVRGLPISGAHSRFSLTNGTWQLPDLFIRRPDGDTAIACTVDIPNEEFHCVLDGGVDPKALQPLLADPKVRKAFDLFTFTSRPLIQAEARGHWRDLQTVVVQGRVAITNFTFKGETCDEFSAQLLFTNSVLNFSDTLVRQGEQRIVVPAGACPIPGRVVYVTNAVSTMDPDLVVRVIGPKVRAAIRPYHFLAPPHVVVNGRIPTIDEADADVHFKVKGGKLNYWRINLGSVSGDVFWRGEYLNITNIQATAYGGTATWHGEFDFTVPHGAQIKMDGYVRNADLHDLMADLTRTTNRLSGKLTGRVNISDANSEDLQSWQGAGWVRLRDGYLWDIPIFGIFSPVLNTIVPGLGHSPVSSGNASFTINRSVVKTKNLEVRSPALRLRYNGSVDFKGAVEARVQAEVLRDAWAVGRVVSFALWPIAKAFEYRIHGTVNQPKTEPLYIPKMLLWPLHPFRNTREFFERTKPSQVEPESEPEPELERPEN